MTTARPCSRRGRFATRAAERCSRRSVRQLGETLTPTPGSAGKIGVGPPVERHNVGFGSALASRVIEPMRVWVAAIKGLMHIFFGREQPELVGPVGIVKVTHEASGDGVGTAIKVVGLLNAYLLWIPSILAFVFFPRGSRAKGSPHTGAAKPTLSS